MKQETKQVSKKDLQFSVGEITLGDNGDNAKTAPVKLLALSGKPFDSCFWGRCVQDLQGMTLKKKRIAIDLEHCTPIGYINKFDVIENQLVLAGAITPVTETAKDTLNLMQAGVPFESSIDFSPSHISDLIVEQWFTGPVAINGQSIEASETNPLTVFRKWPLRAVAICKSGADDMTESTLQSASQNELINVTICKQSVETKDKEDKVMDTVVEKTCEDLEGTVEAKVEATVAHVEVVEKGQDTAQGGEGDKPVQPILDPKVLEIEPVKPVETVIEAKVEQVEAVATKENLSVEAVTPAITVEEVKAEEKEEVKPSEIFKQFVSAFGTDKASEYFADGMTFECAKDKHYEFLQGQIKTLAETKRSQEVEIEKLKEGLKAKAIRPVDFEQSVGTVGNLWQQYRQIKDSAEKNRFYKAHKAEMNRQ